MHTLVPDTIGHTATRCICTQSTCRSGALQLDAGVVVVVVVDVDNSAKVLNYYVHSRTFVHRSTQQYSMCIYLLLLCFRQVIAQQPASDASASAS